MLCAPLLPTNKATHHYKFRPACAALHFGKTAPQQQQCTAQSCKATLFFLFENTFVCHSSRVLFASYKRNLLSQTSARLRVPALPSHLGIKKTCVIAQWTVQAEGRKATDSFQKRKTREEIKTAFFFLNFFFY